MRLVACRKGRNQSLAIICCNGSFCEMLALKESTLVMLVVLVQLIIITLYMQVYVTHVRAASHYVECL